MSEHTVPIRFVRSALVSAEKYGIDVKLALWNARISPGLMYQDASRITPDQATKVAQWLWKATDDELLRMGPQPVPRGTFRMISLALIHSPDLRTALIRLCEFSRITTGFSQAALIEGEYHARVEFGVDPGRDVEPVTSEIILSVVQRFAAWLIGKRIVLEGLEFPFDPPSHKEDYDLIFGCVPTFDTERARMTFAVEYLSAPVIREERELLTFIKNSPADLLFRRDYGSTSATKVRKLIERSQQGRWPTADQAADSLAISAQRLRRLLNEESTSFRQIKEEILRDAAIASLVSGDDSVEDISERLGFSEPSAFRRAFRRWTGSPPGAYRPHRVS